MYITYIKSRNFVYKVDEHTQTLTRRKQNDAAAKVWRGVGSKMTLLQCATRLHASFRKQIYARAKDSRPFGSYIHDMGCLPFAAASFCFRPQLKLSQQRHFASVPPSRRLFARGTTQRHPPGRAAREKTSGNHKVGTGAKGARPHPTSARPQGAPSSPLAATTQDHRAGGHARKHPPEAVRPRGAGQRLLVGACGHGRRHDGLES